MGLLDCEKNGIREQKTVETFALWALYAFAAVNVVLILLAIHNRSVWIDEGYTLSYIRMPYKRIIETLKTEANCPLYFFTVKFIVDTLHRANAALPDVVIIKCFSIIPILLLVLVAATKVKQCWGALSGAFFAVCVTGMPQMMHYAVELRTYSWLMLFVTLSFLFAHDCAAPPPRTSWA